MIGGRSGGSTAIGQVGGPTFGLTSPNDENVEDYGSLHLARWGDSQITVVVERRRVIEFGTRFKGLEGRCPTAVGDELVDSGIGDTQECPENALRLVHDMKFVSVLVLADEARRRVIVTLMKAALRLAWEVELEDSILFRRDPDGERGQAEREQREQRQKELHGEVVRVAGAM